jgi:hypothetical protein
MRQFAVHPQAIKVLVRPSQATVQCAESVKERMKDRGVVLDFYTRANVYLRVDIRAFSNSAFLSDMRIFSHLYVVPNSRTYTDFSICWNSLLLLFSDCSLIGPPEKAFCSLV